MASQYITFLLVFALGLSMVVVVNNIFSGLTDEMRDSVTAPTVEDTLKSIKKVIYSSYMMIKNGMEGDRVSVTITELPVMLANQYLYSISSHALGEQFYLELVVDKRTSLFTVSEALGLSSDAGVSISVSLSSAATTHYLTATKTSSGVEINVFD
ncbi:MAG: hypothetical protein ACTSP4_04605 [Candidatus Hodarchaeales archaeon]